MERLYTVTTFYGIYKINFINSIQFVNEIENLTGILEIDQMYYVSGERVFSMESVLNFSKHEFQILQKKQGSAKYFVRTPTNVMKVYVSNFKVKTVKDLLSGFTTSCRKNKCIYPSNQYAFQYNDETLELSHPLSEIPPDSDINLVKKSIYPPLELLTLNIELMNKKPLKIEIYSIETVLELKNMQLLNRGIPTNEITLIFNSHELEDEKILDSYQITNNSVIQYVFKGKGGKVQVLDDFFDINSPQRISFAKQAPKWRNVKPGLSWKGLCQNKNCEAYNHNVISNSGFGICKIKYQKNFAKCPLCEKKLSNLSGCGFYSCRFTFEGCDAKNNNVKSGGIAGIENYTAFWKSSDIKWKWLDIQVCEMDEDLETGDEEPVNDQIIEGLLG